MSRLTQISRFTGFSASSTLPPWVTVAAAAAWLYLYILGLDPPLLFVGLFAYGVIAHYRGGVLGPAVGALGKADTRKAVKLLAKVRYPNLLSSRAQAYYGLVLAYLAAKAGNSPEARSRLQSALQQESLAKKDRKLAKDALAELSRRDGR